MVTCVIKRIEGPDLVADMGKTEARILRKEQSKLESFSVGDRVRCVIKAVEKTGKNAGVILSRAAPELVMRLFEQEVPEIYDSTIVIKGCAREAGERTKIAVSSRDRDVDSVGACVGMKGMRVQSIIRELRGEKIDIIEFSEDPVVFATHALSPAKISRVTIVDAAGHHMEVIVDDTQLSLAIGKKGQNVRLAAKLLGWRIDIKSEEEKRREVEAQFAGLELGGDATDGDATDGAPADGDPTDGAPADGAPADGDATDGAPTDGAPTDGAPADGDAIEGGTTEGEAAQDGEAPADKAVAAADDSAAAEAVAPDAPDAPEARPADVE
jgi:transcription antitermination factor NusA-like protein